MINKDLQLLLSFIKDNTSIINSVKLEIDNWLIEDRFIKWDKKLLKHIISYIYDDIAILHHLVENLEDIHSILEEIK